MLGVWIIILLSILTVSSLPRAVLSDPLLSLLRIEFSTSAAQEDSRTASTLDSNPVGPSVHSSYNLC